MSKDLLKEAIADAKAVRETAIANAKLALEEAFTPKLQSMLSAKLQEDDMEDEDEVDVDAVEMAHGDEEAEEGKHEEAAHDDEAEAEEGMREEDEDHEAEEGMREEEEEDHEAEEGMREEDEEEDLELEAIIKELEGEDEDEAEEGMREQSDSSDIGNGDNKMDQVDSDTEDPGKGKLSEEEDEEEIDLDEVIKSLTEEDDEEEGMREEDEEDELEEAYATIKSLKATLQEVNLLNAKLLFSNKLFKGNNLSESQKMKVIETFDRASNLREVKLVYSTLAESFTGKSVKKGLTEGFASKKSNSTAPKGKIVESNGMADRMKRLAGLL